MRVVVGLGRESRRSARLACVIARRACAGSASIRRALARVRTEPMLDSAWAVRSRDYLNAAVALDTDARARCAHARRSSRSKRRWDACAAERWRRARSISICCGSTAIAVRVGVLVVPHPRLTSARLRSVPLLEVAPGCARSTRRNRAVRGHRAFKDRSALHASDDALNFRHKPERAQLLVQAFARDAERSSPPPSCCCRARAAPR